VDYILNNGEFTQFRDLIYESSGIHFYNSNRSILESRIKLKLKKNESLTISDFYSLLKRDEQELKIFLDSITTNLTRFFRNTAHFQSFEYHVIPELIKFKTKKNDNRIKIWSAGCSTGEEPYSIAIVLKELLPRNFKSEIVASDLSLKSLMTAKEGYYPEKRVNGIREKYLQRYFSKKDNGYLIKKEIKDMIKFDYHNLKFDSGLRNLDVIFCRNVIIYFDEAAQKNVISRFWDALSNHSYLFIGHSESLFGMDTKFEFLKTEWACLYRKFTGS